MMVVDVADWSDPEKLLADCNTVVMAGVRKMRTRVERLREVEVERNVRKSSECEGGKKEDEENSSRVVNERPGRR